MTDDGLLRALLSATPERLIEIVSTMPAESIAPLLGLIGNADVAKMPGSPAAQAVELNPKYVSRPHIDYLSDRLTQAWHDVRAGETRYLLVSMPPRMGKTELISVYLPLWILRQDHTAKIGIISHSPLLAASWGRRIRREVVTHGATLGLSIAPDAGAVSEWETPEGGGVMSRSIGQALAGVGFNVLIVDDPTRDFAAAHSEPARKSVWEWWTANAQTRLEPPSLVVVVQTRWHEDDLTGRILSPEHEGDPNDWEQIIFPALATGDDVLGRKEGEPLLSPLEAGEDPASPDAIKHALKRWAKMRSNVGSYAWSALFQQSPSPAAGAIFNLEWWRFWTSNPASATSDGRVVHLDPEALRSAHVVTSWDATFKDTKSSDYVVGQRWARIKANRYLLDQVRDRMSFTATLSAMKRFLKSGLGHEYAHVHLVEDKANGPAILDSLRDEVSGLKPVNPRGSKEARARAVTPEIESGNVYLPDPKMPGYEWVNALIGEARSFPTGEHDDQVDAMTQALDGMRSPGVAGLSVPGSRPAGAAPSSRPLVATRTISLDRARAARGDIARRRG